MTPSRSRVRIDRIDLDLVYYTLHMSMGKRVRERQPEMWVATTNFPTAASQPFYTPGAPLLAFEKWVAENRKPRLVATASRATLRLSLRAGFLKKREKWRTPSWLAPTIKGNPR
jgi:hypothetical protein